MFVHVGVSKLGKTYLPDIRRSRLIDRDSLRLMAHIVELYISVKKIIMLVCRVVLVAAVGW